MKKLLTLLLAGALALSAFTACDQTPSESDTSGTVGHIHTPAGGWDRNAKEHWHVCEDGEKMDVAAHTLDDMNVCNICNSAIIDWGDGTFDVDTDNEYGETVRRTSYDADGNVISENRYEIEYDADGNKTFAKFYEDERLADETYYALGADGVYETKIISYYEDGSPHSVNEYDTNGDNVLAYFYDETGKERYRIVTEYAEDENGDRYESKSTDYDYINEKIYIGEYNAFEDQISRTVTDLEGNLIVKNRYEHGYDENGDNIYLKEYKNDILVFEILSYEVYTEEDYWMKYPKMTVEYEADGSKKVSEHEPDGSMTVSEYDASGTLVKETAYDSEGNEINQ